MDLKRATERIKELEMRERDLLFAAQIGRDLLEKNTELELENRKYQEEIESLTQKVHIYKNVSHFYFPITQKEA